jgi:hypothetical protein
VPFKKTPVGIPSRPAFTGTVTTSIRPHRGAKRIDGWQRRKGGAEGSIERVPGA